MKKIFALLVLITLTTVAFTSQANGAGENQTKFLVSDFSPDYVAVATIDVQVVYQVNNIAKTSVEIASSEVVIPNIVFEVNKVIYAEANLPNEVGLITNNKTDKGVNYAKIHLPNEVGLSNSNI